MKYAVNHHWKFESYQIAWLCGWMQSFNVIIVELVNFAALLTNFTIIEIIRNFLALVVISQFDEYFFSTVKSDPLAEIVDGDDHYEEFLKIQRTTSNRASRIKNNAQKSINQIKGQECEKELWDQKQAEKREKLESKKLKKLKTQQSEEFERINSIGLINEVRRKASISISRLSSRTLDRTNSDDNFTRQTSDENLLDEIDGQQ